MDEEDSNTNEKKRCFYSFKLMYVCVCVCMRRGRGWGANAESTNPKITKNSNMKLN